MLSGSFLFAPFHNLLAAHPSKRFSMVKIAPIIAVGCLAISGARAQTNFGTQQLNSPTTQSVAVTSTGSGSVSEVRVLTYGAANQDYIDAGGNCATANFAAAGQTCSESVTFTPKYPGQRLGAVVLVDSNGNVLGRTLLQGVGLGGLAVFVPGMLNQIAGGGGASVVKDGSSAMSAGLNNPAGVALDGEGNLYIADSQHNRIRMVSSGSPNGSTIHNVAYPAQGNITTIAGNGNSSWSGDGNVTSSSLVSLKQPTGIAIDGAGDLYIAETGSNVIRKITAATGVISTIAGNAYGYGSSGDGGPAANALLAAPKGVSVDSAGNIYIADNENHKIRAICAAAGALYGVSCAAANNIVTIAGSASGAGYSGDGGPAALAKLNSPFAPAFDSQQNMYIPDSGNQRIREVKPSGSILTVAGTGTQGGSASDTDVSSARLNTPTSVAFDAADNMYICDSGNSAIRKVNLHTGKIASLFWGIGTYVNGQVLSTITLYNPRGITLDGSGSIYIADYAGNRVKALLSNTALLDFTAIPVRQGEVSSPKSQILENDGNDQLAVSSLTTDANSLIDSSGTTCASSSVLAVNAQCTISAEFAPTTTGNPLLATVSVANQSQNSPLLLTLAGNATSMDSTTVALTSNQNPAVYAQSLTISATVTTGATTGQPTGTLTFYDGTKVLQSGVAVDSLGNGSISISTLSVGSHSITATYSGDALHTGSTSYAMTQLVNEPTAVAIAASANPATLDTAVKLTATVSTPSGGGVAPDGLVAFLDGTTTLATVAVDSTGTASYTTSALSQGAHTLTAQYGGDLARYIKGSTSSKLDLGVLAPSTIALTSTPNPSSYGTAVTYAATLNTSGTLAPTGAVSFLDGSQQIGSATLSGTSGVITFTTSALSAGAHTITASYAGDSAVQSSTSASLTQVVTPAQTITTMSVNPAQPIAGTPVTLAATVSLATGSAQMSGTVSFMDGASKLGVVPVSSAGSASITTVFSPGTHNLSAVYSGDPNNSANTSVQIAAAVNTATTQVMLTASSSPAQVLSNVVFTAAVTGNGGVPTGNVSFTVDGTVAATSVVDSNGKATASFSSLSLGAHTISATYSGDTYDGSSSANLNEVINPISTTTQLNTSSTGGGTPQTILVASVTGTGGPVPTGTMSFASGSTVLGSATLDAAGVATLVPVLPAGTYNVTATYSGDAYHGTSTSTAVSISGDVVDFVVKTTPANLTLTAGQAGTVTISLTSSSKFSDTVKMGCLGLPVAVTCHFASDTVVMKPGESHAVQVVIDTTLPANAGQVAELRGRGMNPVAYAGIMLPPGVLLGCLLWQFRRRNKAILATVAVIGIAVSAMLTGCGTSYSMTTVAPGTYTIQIGGTGATTTSSNFQTVTLTIKK